MDKKERERRLRIFESDWGRQHGWYITHEGRNLAELVEPEFAGMYWTRYKLHPLSEDPRDLERLKTSEFWDECPRLVSREFDEVAPNAFPAAAVDVESGHVVYRSDCLDIGQPSIWERVLLWRRRLHRKP